MSQIRFYNIKIDKSESTGDVVVRGDIENKTGRSYGAVAVKIILFIKNIPIAHATAVINGLQNGQTKGFEKNIDELQYEQVGRDISRHDIYVDSSY